MQFFPVADIFNSSASALPAGSVPTGFSNENIYSYAPMNNGESSFKDIFKKVSDYNSANTPGVPVTMRSTKDDNSYLKSDDFKVLKEKLTELGVDPGTIDKFFGQISTQANHPTLGTLGSALVGMNDGERVTEAMSEQEMVAFRTLAEKLGFTHDEMVELEEKIAIGDTFGIFQAFQRKMEGQDLNLDKNELLLICRAADLTEEQITPVLAYWDELANEDKIIFSKEVFHDMFGTVMAELEQDLLKMQHLADSLGEAVLAMLNTKQTRSEGPVSNKRGSALTERTETMARIIATLINEEENKNEENGTSHLIDNNGSNKLIKKQSTIAAILEKANKEVSREMQEAPLISRGQNGEALDTSVKSAAFGVAANAAKNAEQPQVNQANNAALRAPADSLLRDVFGTDEYAAKNSTDEKGEKSRQDLFGSSHRNADAALSVDKAALNAKVQEAPGMVFGMFSGTENSSQSSQTAQAAKSEIYHERIFDQIERGIIKNATDGSKQITIRLDPPELGKLTLSLTVAQGEVKAVIRTESSATTQVVSEQLAQLKQSLEEQGFKVSSLEVETRAQSHAGTDNWNGAEQHNQERELQEQQRFSRLSRMRAKETDTLAQGMQYSNQPASISASGIHIIA